MFAFFGAIILGEWQDTSGMDSRNRADGSVLLRTVKPELW